MKVKDTTFLLRLYECMYGLGCATVLAGSGLALALTWSFSQAYFLLPVPLAALGLFAACIVRRWREFRRYDHIPGPKPTFFLGNLRSLLARDHGARDRALVELHRVHGPVVKLHMAWGSTPLVSLSAVPKELRQKDLDSNRRADRTVLPNSLMGLKSGDKHLEHRHQLNRYFTPREVLQRASQLADVSSSYLQVWKSGQTKHGALESDLHHWSANSLGVFLCGLEWKPQDDLTSYLAAIACLEEAISFKAFHPFFVKRLFSVRARGERAAYSYLFDTLEAALERRLHVLRDSAAHDVEPRDVLGKLARLKLDARSGETSWSHEECVEELISLVMGGTDAMSYTLAQALYLLSRNPDVQNQAREQLMQSGMSADASVHPYVLNIIRETTRLFPAVPFSSKVVEKRPLELLGVSIPAKTNVMWMKTAVGLNNEIFSDAERFAPNRFAGGGRAAQAAESIASAMPFGAGLRHCIGQHLAEYLCTRFLTAIISEFELVPIHDVTVRFSATVSVTPSTVPVRLVPRNASFAVARCHAPARRSAEPKGG